MSTYFVQDTTALFKRSMRHILRSPDTIITTAITPIAMLLLFVYVFGGAINVGGASYVNYLLPGILLITVASGIAYTAFRLFTDVSGGIFERFQSMPISRSAVLWSHVLTSIVANLVSLVLVVLVAVAMGFRSGAGVLAWLAVQGIMVLFTLALTWLALIPGLTANNPPVSNAVKDTREGANIMSKLLTKILGDKKEWKAMEARAAALPRDYRIVYGEMKTYMWKFTGGDGMDTIAVLKEVLVLFETSTAEGRSVLEVTGQDVAAFCDERLSSATSYMDFWRASLNRDVAAKLAK